MIPSFFRPFRAPEPKPLRPRPALRPRAHDRHAPALSSVRVELQDGSGVTHSGQLWNISASGAALCFGRSQIPAYPGLLTNLRICSRSGSGVLALPVEVRWMDLDHGACFVGVRFVESLETSAFLRDLLAA